MNRLTIREHVTHSDVPIGRNGQIGPTALYLARMANDPVKGPVSTEMTALKRLAKTQLISNIAIPALVKHGRSGQSGQIAQSRAEME